MSDQSKYMDLVFGDNEGHVAVAYKDPDDSWQEHQFSWPRDKTKIINWAHIHRDAHIFICPALRKDPHTRKKGDGIYLRWLWADVDMEKIPATKKSLVERRIKQMASMVVWSGTGDNRHVYVKLGEEVDVHTHYRLNVGLRDYLYADAKHPDNSLLRLPGMTNWKTAAGTKVRLEMGHTKAFSVAAFTKLKAFANVSVLAHAESSGVEWTPVDVSGVPARYRRMMNMSPDEARGRYGSRHKAVWAVVAELYKAGFDPDMIHTLMDDFVPAQDKRDDEHGAYDVHKDVVRRLLTLVPEQGDDSPFTDLTDEQVAAMGSDNPLVRKELARREAMREVEHIEAQRRFMAPPDDVSWCVADVAANPPDREKYLIAGNADMRMGLAGSHHNVVITAQYKVGKTAFVMGSLAPALCDGKEFLGQFPVAGDGVVVGHWNCEMEGWELWEDYIEPSSLINRDRLHVANLRGYAVNILTPVGKAWAVEWLRTRGVKVWTIDSLARLLRMCGVKEKENDDVLNVLMAIDEIKVEAEVDVCFLIAHTGRGDMEEGKERARGATVIDDWPDARWIMTRDGDVRFIMVEGRGVALGTTSLEWNADTRGCVLGVGGRADVRADAGVQTVFEIVSDADGINQSALVTKVRERSGVGIRTARDMIAEAVECGWIRQKRIVRKQGGRPQVTYEVTARSGDTGATPRPVDMRKVRGGGRKQSSTN